MKKRMLSILLALVMVLGMLSVTAGALHIETTGGDTNAYAYVVYNANAPAGAVVQGVPSGTQAHRISWRYSNYPGNMPDVWTYHFGVTISPAPTCAGYTFGGWYADAACSESASTRTSAGSLSGVSKYTEESPLQVYAKWTPHDHDALTYAVNAAGDGVIETCTCGHTASAYLWLNPYIDLTYTGNAIRPVGMTYSSGWQGATGATVSYQNNTNVGTATAKATVEGKTISKAFEITQAEPEYTVPTGLKAEYGDTLADVALPDGWTWDDTTTSVGEVGEKTFKATYTPSDTTNYKSVTADVTVTVEKAEPEYTQPSGLTATVGQTLSDVALPDGWTWVNPGASVGSAGENKFEAVYTPADTTNYETVTVELTVAVKKPLEIHTHCVCNTSECTDHETITWTAWTEGDSLPTTSGNYYLTDDVKLASAWVPANGAYLCLNGHSITYVGTGKSSVIVVSDKVVFTLTDCGTTGTVTGGKATNGGGIHVTGAVRMYGGTISGNSAERGGGVYLDGGSFVLYGGAVSGNEASQSGGGIHTGTNFYDGGSVSVYGGTISNNKSVYGGGGIYLAPGGALGLRGGVITGNQTTVGASGAGVYSAAATINLNGAPVVTGNTNATGGASNLSFYRYMNLKGELTKDAQIGISGNPYTLFTKGWSSEMSNADANDYFTPDDSKWKLIQYIDGEWMLGQVHKHCVCNTDKCGEHDAVEWVPWLESDSLPTTSGNYYLTQDVTIDGGSGFFNNQNVQLCLNGHKVELKLDAEDAENMKGCSFITVRGGSLTVTDCSDQECYGTIDETTGQWTATEESGDCNLTGGVIINSNGTGINVEQGAVLTMYGGNIAGCCRNAVEVDSSSAFRLHGGSLIGNADSVVNSGGAVCNAGTMTMTGGTISGTTGNGISNSGTLTLSGGEISGSTGDGIDSTSGTLVASGGKILNNTGDGIETGGSMTLSGGTISGNDIGISVVGGNPNLTGGTITGNKSGMYLYNNSTVTVSGNLKITGNTNENVFLFSGKTLTIGGALTQGAQIGIAMFSPNTFTSGWPTYMGTDNGKGWFTSDRGKEILVDTNGELMLMHSTHKYTYTAENNVITESCTCGHSETATLNAPTQLKFDGTPKIASVTYSDGWQGGDLTIEYDRSGDCTSVGTVTASITKSEATAVKVYEIETDIPDYTLPENVTAEYGDKLSDVDLPDGWEWVDPTITVDQLGENTFSATYTDEDGRFVTVDITVTVTKAAQEAPAAPELKYKSANSITVKTEDGMEYSIDGVNWQTSGTFKGLKSNTRYTVYARVAETDTHFASPASEGLEVTTSRPSSGGVIMPNDPPKEEQPEEAPKCDGTGNCPSLAYRDLDVTQWYHEATDFVLEKGLMNGIGENRFNPTGTTSRAMVVTILWRLEGCPVVNYLMQFEDVPAETWYTEAVRWAAAERIVTGYGATFGPEDNITREQLATILYRYEQYKGGGFTGMWMFLLNAADRNQISDWAYEAMCWMTMNGIINGKGDGILDPQGSATRVEVAQVLMNYIKNTK